MKIVIDNSGSGFKKLPSWFKQDIPDVNKTKHLKRLLESSNLNTVCQSALCPNLGQCWGRGVATFMILGDVCTRACRFCAVKSGTPLSEDKQEPTKVALAVEKLGLKYVVITSVTRDDLPDKGCGHFIKTILKVREINPGTKIEVLIPDFDNEIKLLKELSSVRPDVVSHNIEMVKRVFLGLRPQAVYERSLSVLRNLKDLNPRQYVKSGFMVGLSETNDEVVALMNDLYNSGCDILTIGQYLAPSGTKRHVKESRFVTPEEFDVYKKTALDIGFKHVVSGPLVRSSFMAEDAFNEFNGQSFVPKGTSQ